MIEIDGIEYRTSVQWEKKHRHVKKSQLEKGIERTWRSLWRRDARLVVLRVVDHVPAVFVMADLAGSVVFENHTPRFANMIVSHRPGARSVRFDLFE